jgi:chromosome partitioning protein
MKSPELHTITIANLKGGVGKTTTAVSLAAGLAMKGRRTLLVDMDSQVSATAHLLDGEALAGADTIFEVLDGEKGLMEAALATHVEGLSLVTTGDRRDRYETFGRSVGRDELALRNVLAGLKGEPLDYVVIDTPPSIDTFSVNAIAASDWIIVPVTCEYLPLLGLRKFNQALSAIRERLQVETGILGYLLTMVDRRERITWEVEGILKKTFGSLLFRTQIRIDTKIKACPSHRKTIFEYESPEGRARSDFEQLVREVLERVESRYEKGVL